MMQQPKRWLIAPLAPDSYKERLSHLPPLIVQLLYNRNLTDPADAEIFLKGETRLDDPFRIRGMNEAVTRIRNAIRSGEPIAVYGDFDADGVTATALLVQALDALGGIVQPYIPHRVDEGYGLNRGALARLARDGQKLVITVDCGIRSREEVTFANQRGMDVIITDHHSLGPELPPALAAINPKRPDCPYPFKGLAGVGLAYKLAQALLRSHQQVAILRDVVVELEEGDLLDLVALGTVADLAPLLGENRSLVQRGLERLNQPQRLGLQALLAAANQGQGQVTASTIGYVLGPRLNAAGRLDSAMLSYELLQTQDGPTATQLAGQLDRLNRQRQELTVQALETAQAQIEADGADSYLFLASSKDFRSGVVGLVAGRLAERYYRPTLVVEEGERQSRGSARSIPEFDITAALDRCAAKGLLVRHGGHAAAAGFTVRNELLPALREELVAIATEELAGTDLRPSLSIDAEVSLGDLDWATSGLLRQLEPTGFANPRPLFVSRRVRLREARQVGREGNHLKLTVSDPEAGPRQEMAWEAIAFRQGHHFGSLPHWIDLVYSLEENEWNGQRRLQLNVADLLASQ